MTEVASPAEDTMVAIRDRCLGPSLLLPYADDMARRIARLSIGPLLETAAGTGVLTQALASATSAGLTIIATDPDARAIDHASVKPGMARVTWQRAEPHALPFPDAAFGLVTCHFAMAMLPDRVGALREARRVMKPNGRFVFSVAGNLRHNPAPDCLQAALDDAFAADPPRFLAVGLHGYADNETIDDDLTAVGFTDAIYTTIELPFVAASARDIAIGYCLGTPLRNELEQRGAIDPIIDIATAALQKRFGTGMIETSMRAHFISASG